MPFDRQFPPQQSGTSQSGFTPRIAIPVSFVDIVRQAKIALGGARSVKIQVESPIFRENYKAVSATGNLFVGAVSVLGFLCATSSSGTLNLYDSATTTTTDPVTGTLSLVAGTYYPIPANVTQGIYAVIGGTATGTLYLGSATGIVARLRFGNFASVVDTAHDAPIRADVGDAPVIAIPANATYLVVAPDVNQAPTGTAPINMNVLLG